MMRGELLHCPSVRHCKEGHIRVRYMCYLGQKACLRVLEERSLYSHVFCFVSWNILTDLKWNLCCRSCVVETMLRWVKHAIRVHSVSAKWSPMSTVPAGLHAEIYGPRVPPGIGDPPAPSTGNHLNSSLRPRENLGSSFDPKIRECKSFIHVTYVTESIEWTTLCGCCMLPARVWM